MKNTAIKLKDISKRYTLRHEKPTLVENILFQRRKEDFWALKNISFSIKKGERIGLIGPNGSGKTTLLEIIAGITKPTKGRVETKGKLASLIELEAGFHPELTGEENIHLNGLLVGMTKGEVSKKFEKIVSFAGLGEFIDAPFYTYSEGMKLRLGFSVVVHTDPDIILLDENMAVGDKKFREKSYKKIGEFIKKGKTMILVSHYMDWVRKHCDRVIYLDEGKIKADGKKDEVIKSYERVID